MSPFHVGMQVVCVNDQPLGPFLSMGGLTEGRVYTIREIVDWKNWGVCLRLEEIVRPCADDRASEDTPYLVRRFRPVRKTDISCFTAMLSPNPKEKERV